MSTSQGSSRPLHLQTIESLFAELLGGAGVSVGDGDVEFRVASPDSKAILNWFRVNRAKWPGNVMTPDVEAMVSAVLSPFPVLPIPSAATSKSERRLRLKRLVAHRFAGIHAYGTADKPPPEFEFEPRESITLFEGWNGSGKTSLLNAIIWCLTGEILRPQRQPEGADEEFTAQFVRSVDGSDATTNHALTPITPLPNPREYVPPFDKPVPIDSWVEITFVDQDGVVLQPVRRSQLRNAKGKLSETKSGFDSLGVDPIALRIGTIMPALLQFIKVGSSSDLGAAAAKLTGLADLSTLEKYAAKAQEKLKGEYRKEREREIDELDVSFKEARSDLEKQITEYPEMAPEAPLPEPSAAKDLEQQLEGLRNHFNTQKSVALSKAQAILGSDFDPSNKEVRANLETSIGPAQGQLKSMGQLQSVRRFRALAELTDADWQTVDDLLSRMRDEAAVLAELEKTPDLGRRKQLYARVAAWIADVSAHDLTTCAVCSRSLQGVVDPVTQRAVSEHLAEVSEKDQRLLSLTKENWCVGWEGILASQCPVSLQPELNRDLPSHPHELIRAALADDLFESESFRGSLITLKSGVAALCDQELPKLGAFSDPAMEQLPESLQAVGTSLQTKIRRLARARAFAAWRAADVQRIGEVTRTIVSGDSHKADSIGVLTPIAQKLESLASIVKGVAPLNAALDYCNRMEAQLKVRRQKEKRIGLYGRAINALNSVLELGSLAEQQVDRLRKLLHVRTAYWRDRCYHNSFPMGGHALRETAMDIRGVLDIRVGFEKANAPAQHISNASALRATLMGFFLAFWEHVIETRGGIEILLLDDPQEVLDQDNKMRLARVLPELAGKGGQLMVATYDRSFARAAVAAGRTFNAHVEHRSVHPVNPGRSVLKTAAAEEELRRRRSAYEQDKDSASSAQDYADEVRVFLEARLSDLFDDPAYPAYAGSTKEPTLSDHLGHIRGLFNNPPNAFFKGVAVKRLCECKALAQGAECLKVLNTAHHNKSSLSAGDVFAVVDDLELVCELAETLSREFRHWRWDEPLLRAKPPNNVVAFKSLSSPSFNVLIHPDLAAFTGSSTLDATQDIATETVDGSWFADKTLFLVRDNNLGFSVPDGCVAIAESSPYEGKDHHIVIARQKGHLLARRLFRPHNGDQITLAAEAPDPRQSKPTLQFEIGGLVLHRIVGMLTEQPSPPYGKGEAIELLSAKSLVDVTTAYRVRDESGVPLALPGQVVLGGASITKDQLAASVGVLVALCLSDGSGYFKRIGTSVPGSNGRLWQFESIGGLGSSLVVSLDEPVEISGAPRFISARRIIAVLYTA